MSFSERRLVRESAFDITSKLFRISWLYVLLLTMLAAVGYAALYSAAGGSPEPYAGRHMLRFGFGLVMMLCIAMIDIRFIQRMSWVACRQSHAALAFPLPPMLALGGSAEPSRAVESSAT